MRTRNPVSAMVSEKFIIVDVSLHKPRLPHIPFAQGFPFRAHVDKLPPAGVCLTQGQMVPSVSWKRQEVCQPAPEEVRADDGHGCNDLPAMVVPERVQVQREHLLQSAGLGQPSHPLLHLQHHDGRPQQ